MHVTGAISPMHTSHGCACTHTVNQLSKCFTFSPGARTRTRTHTYTHTSHTHTHTRARAWASLLSSASLRLWMIIVSSLMRDGGMGAGVLARGAFPLLLGVRCCAELLSLRFIPSTLAACSAPAWCVQAWMGMAHLRGSALDALTEVHSAPSREERRGHASTVVPHPPMHSLGCSSSWATCLTVSRGLHSRVGGELSRNRCIFHHHQVTRERQNLVMEEASGTRRCSWWVRGA